MKNKVAIAVSTALMSFTTFNASADLSGKSFVGQESLVEVKATSINKGQVYSDKRSNKFNYEKGLGSEKYIYIVRLKDQPIAMYDGSIKGLAATNPKIAKKDLFNKLAKSNQPSRAIRDELRVDFKSEEVKAYGAYLESKQQKFLSQVDKKLKSGFEVKYQYKNVFNGVALELTQDEAAQLAKMSDVAFVERERQESLETDTGPIHIGATRTWVGEGQNATKMGEGVIIGVVDSGINSDHPSFADVGADGYDHTNPWGQGVYVGDCAGDFPEMCNDKLIGVRSYAAVTDNYQDEDVFGDNPPPANGEDYDGHGSHTASTAGGNILRNVPLLDPETGEIEGDGINSTGFEFDQISGVAPHANIVAYQICNPGASGDTYSGCPGAAIVAALEDAVADGVDVINYSISGGGNPWESATEQAFLSAQEAGIFASVSAGNDGPDANTTVKSAPWYTVVGAATHGREVEFAKDINFTGGDSELAAISGKSASGAITASIVYAGDFENSNDADGDSAQCLEPFPEGTFDGQIVVCDRGAIARVAKAENVAAGGAGGFVLANVEGGSNTVNNDVYVVPGIHINAEDSTALRAWLASGTNHGASITAADGELVISADNADNTADFSSRGPNSFVDDIMTPSVTAPGVSIYAAFADQQFGHDVTTPTPTDFNFLQGTSMSAPHVAGAGAILRSSHPTWTADNIRSALMLTATDDVKKEDGVTPADVFDMGAGRIRVDLADQTGLIMNETAANYTAANPATGGDPKTLNVPSVSNANCVGSCSWTRTFTATEDGSWAVTGESISDGLVITVSPTSFDIEAGETQEVQISVDALAAQSNQWAFGNVILTSAQHPEARVPVSVVASTGNIPDELTFDAVRDVDSFTIDELRAVEISDFTVRSYGLTKADQTVSSLAVDSDNSSPYDDLADGVQVTLYDVPEDAKRFVAEVLKSESPDLDMFVGIDTNGDGIPQEDEQIAVSATGTALERIDLVSPDSGSYWVIIQNWAASSEDEGVQDQYTLATAIVDGELGEGLSVETENLSIEQLTDFAINFKWSLDQGVNGDVFLGAFDLGTDAENAGNLGLTVVDIRRGKDDVTITNNIDERILPDDQIDYEISVAANFMQDDRQYTITAEIPEGLELDSSSVTGAPSVEGNTLIWTVDRPSLLGAAPSYTMTTNANDPTCVTPFGNGSYVNLASFGINPGTMNGDTQVGTFNISTNYLGNSYSSLNVTDDGFIFFSGDAGDNPAINQLLPDSARPNNLIAPMWRDLEIVRTNTSGVSVASTSAFAIIEFDDVQHWLSVNGSAASGIAPGDISDNMDFEVIINRDTGDFMFAYDNVTHDFGNRLGGTVGYEGINGSNGRADIYRESIYGGADGSIGSIEDIQSGLIMCYRLTPVPSEPVVFNFSTAVAGDYRGGNLAVALTNEVNSADTEVVSIARGNSVEVEGAPIADISNNTNIREGDIATFDGTVSTDPNDDQLTYLWVQVGGPSVSFNRNSGSISFTAPEINSESQVISFELTVTDPAGNSDSVISSSNIIQGNRSSGGSFGWLLLLGLPLLALRRKLR